VFWHTEEEPKILIGAWFAFTTTELWNLAGIKKAEVKNQKNNDGDKDADAN
jgi:hypothetical protein